MEALYEGLKEGTLDKIPGFTELEMLNVWLEDIRRE